MIEDRGITRRRQGSVTLGGPPQRSSLSGAKAVPNSLKLAEVFVVAIAALAAPVAPCQTQYQVLHNFGASSDGTLPSGALAIDAGGHLYGVTSAGGSGMCSDYGCGTVYELALSGAAWTETILQNFDFYTEGSAPFGPLALDSSWNLYGVTSVGGPSDFGTVFELLPSADGWDLSVIYGAGSEVGPVDRPNGLYGLLGAGQHQAGAIAELSPGPDDWVYTQLYSFCSLPHCVDGYDVKWPLALDTKGNIYGTTYFGGVYGYGLAFQLSRTPAPSASDAWTYHIMHSFGAFPTDGGRPGSGLVLDSLGNAYGVSYNGGTSGNGAVYKLTPFPAAPWLWRETQIYDFPADLENGGFPVGNLVFDQAGNLYGSAGGGTGCNPYGCGVIFKLTPSANGQWTYSVVHKFNGQDGFGPNPLAIDGNGNLFGTTQIGGTYNLGVAFEITP